MVRYAAFKTFEDNVSGEGLLPTCGSSMSAVRSPAKCPPTLNREQATLLRRRSHFTSGLIHNQNFTSRFQEGTSLWAKWMTQSAPTRQLRWP
mmetsp:Transcript_7933/g.29606  ORF Transcript_7933/g.29606 Transcript_7933/m.29606 type:complete len:92 (+) Transcript_7933:589-864(+)